MKVINTTRNSVLAEEAFVADTPWKRMKGLLGRESLGPSEALIIKPCNSVHTFFMRFSIDILFIDKQNRVVKAISSLAPGHLTSICFAAAFVIELPAGQCVATRTTAGDTLSLIAP